MSYEYKVVPAPARGLKAKGLKTVEDRFANALESAINDLAADGWEYVRADTLPCEQREGIVGKTTVFQNMLVFRRAKSSAAKTARPEPQLSAPLPLSAEDRVAETVSSDSADDDAPTQIADDEVPEKSRKSASPDVAAE